MAEFQFYGTWDDTWAVLKAVLRRESIAFVADLAYHYPRPVWIRTLTSHAREMLHRRRRVYVFGEDFSTRPPCLVQQMTGSVAGKHFVYLAGGGQGLELALPNSHLDEGVWQLDAGRLTYPHEFWNGERGRWEKPTTALKGAFLDVKARLRGELEQHLPIRDLWIGPHAWDLVRDGKARIRVLTLPPGARNA